MTSNPGSTFDSSVPLDAIAWDLLELLQSDGRLSFSELGRRVGLSAPAVADRVRRLEEAGVITGYRAQVNPDAVGMPITAFVRLRLTGAGSEDVVEVARTLPEVREIHGITGEDAYLLKVTVTSVRHLEQLRSELMCCGQSTTAIVLSSPVIDRPIARSAAAPRSPGAGTTGSAAGHGGAGGAS